MKDKRGLAFYGFLSVVLCLLLSGCKGSERIVYAHRTDSVFVARTDTFLQVRMERDSVYLRDSVFVNQYVEGDTVYRERYVTQWRERIRVERDTLWRERMRTEYRERTDTVYVQLPSVEEEKGRTSWWKEFFARMGVYAIIAFVLWLWFSYRVKR